MAKDMISQLLRAQVPQTPVFGVCSPSMSVTVEVTVTMLGTKESVTVARLVATAVTADDELVTETAKA